MSGSVRLFVVVEGKVLDPAFYDQVLACDPVTAANGYEIRLVQQITRGNVGSGGKQAALALFDEYRASNCLRQSNNLGDRLIVFLIDRDYDDLVGSRRRSPHVIYTEHTDVEAEVFAHGDFQEGLRGALSLTRRESEDLAKHIGDPLSHIAACWHDWIVLCCLATAMRSACAVHPSKLSYVNPGLLGPSDVQKVGRNLTLIRNTARTPNPRGREIQISRRVQAMTRRGDDKLLVKGKWVAPYLGVIVHRYFAGSLTVDSASFHNSITRVMVSHLDSSSGWARHWHDKLSLL